jgi:ADP-dependent NAD(P)H-hydrate dehydratase / NAD(P)H-hydrate epimerase
MPFLSPKDIGDSIIPLELLSTTQATTREAQAQATLPAHTLMSRAGESVARLALAKYPHAQQVLILCGAGNNGGDGFVAAKWLQDRGITVKVLAMHAPASQDDATWARHEWLVLSKLYALELNKLQALDLASLNSALPRCDLVIDALLGAGLNRPVTSPMLELIHAINSSAKPVIAVDLPSGLHADTGCVMGAAIHAAVTLALLCLRPGHVTGDAKAYTGELWFHDLNIPSTEYSINAHLLSANTIILPIVSTTVHKGQRGVVGVIGGAAGMRGAPLLSARAALHLGAGRLHVGFIAQATNENTPELDAAEPSLMCHAVTRQVWPFEADVWVFGPGAGMGEDAAHVLNVLLAHTHDQPLVLDADGLNLLATHAVLKDALHARSLPAVLTPHPLEAARLLGCTTAQVQADRVAAAMAIASRYQCVVVLKGAGTVIADVQGQIAINPTGGAWLATAGSGDVLTGVIAAFMAQGLLPFTAACSAVYIHGSAYNISDNETILPRVASNQITDMTVEMRQIHSLQTVKGRMTANA